MTSSSSKQARRRFVTEVLRQFDSVLSGALFKPAWPAYPGEPDIYPSRDESVSYVISDTKVQHVECSGFFFLLRVAGAVEDRSRTVVGASAESSI